MRHCSGTSLMPPDAVSHAPGRQREQGRMQSFVAALLRHEGALVEAIEPDGLEVLAPPSVQRALGIGELAPGSGSGRSLPPAAQAGRDRGRPGWSRCARLLGPQGRVTRCVLSPSARPPGDPGAGARNANSVLDNATFRLLSG